MKKNIWIITLFPEFFEPLKNCGVIGQVLSGKRKLEVDFKLNILNLRDFSTNNYKGVDDTPFGGGAGMLLKADILKNALDGILEKSTHDSLSGLHVVYTAPRGKVWDRELCHGFTKQKILDTKKDLVFICGRYEGIDERFLEKYVNEFISIGDFVLSGGEIAILTILDSSLRFVPGVLGNQDSFEQDSFEQGLLEYPQYTRPRVFEGVEPPEVLTSGNHKKIVEFQNEKQREMTKKYRPDLWEKFTKDNK